MSKDLRDPEIIEKEKKKEALKQYRRALRLYNLKIAGVFIYCCINLFAYPIALGYALSRLNECLWIVGFVCFWIQFGLSTRKDDFLNSKLEEYSRMRADIKYHINNYDHLIYLARDVFDNQ